MKKIHSISIAICLGITSLCFADKSDIASAASSDEVSTDRKNEQEEFQIKDYTHTFAIHPFFIYSASPDYSGKSHYRVQIGYEYSFNSVIGFDFRPYFTRFSNRNPPEVRSLKTKGAYDVYLLYFGSRIYPVNGLYVELNGIAGMDDHRLLVSEKEKDGSYLWGEGEQFHGNGYLYGAAAYLGAKFNIGKEGIWLYPANSSSFAFYWDMGMRWIKKSRVPKYKTVSGLSADLRTGFEGWEFDSNFGLAYRF